MLTGVDRLLKYYFDPSVITNMTLRDWKSRFKFRISGPLRLVCLPPTPRSVCTRQLPMHIGTNTLADIQDLSTLSFANNYPQGNWTQWRGLNMSSNVLGTILSEFWRHEQMRGPELYVDTWILGSLQRDISCSGLRIVLPLQLKSTSYSLLSIQLNLWWFFCFVLFLFYEFP